jgi:farnesyl-diphosphate farnesyltransferase
MADTVEDSTGLSADTRESLFRTLMVLSRAPEDASARARFQSLWQPHPHPHYEALMRNADIVLDAFAALPGTVREPIADCLDEMASGMAVYPPPAGGSPPARVCSDLQDLEAYCHVVAGTVGCLLSRLFAQELGPEWMTPERMERGRRFGLGLQLTNVLKDHEADGERGVAYIPERWMDRERRPAGLTAEGIRILVGRALDHLQEANAYVLSLPRERTDLRLFCLWASHLALATLRVVAETGGAGRAKVGRDELWGILEKARSAAGDDAALSEIHAAYDAAARASAGLAGTQA